MKLFLSRAQELFSSVALALLFMVTTGECSSSGDPGKKKEEEDDDGKRRERIQRFVPIDKLPAGFRFSPTDHEIIAYFLQNRVAGKEICPNPIFNYDHKEFYSNHPKDLCKDKARCFFISEDERFRTQPSRNVGDIGLWRMTEPESQIFDKSNKHLIGSKSGFTFYKIKGPTRTEKKTHWRMTEYQLPLQSYQEHNKWVVFVKISRGRDDTDQ